MLAGKFAVHIEDGVFDVAEYNSGLGRVETEVAQFKARQREAAERWTIGY